ISDTPKLTTRTSPRGASGGIPTSAAGLPATTAPVLVAGTYTYRSSHAVSVAARPRTTSAASRFIDEPPTRSEHRVCRAARLEERAASRLYRVPASERPNGATGATRVGSRSGRTAAGGSWPLTPLRCSFASLSGSNAPFGDRGYSAGRALLASTGALTSTGFCVGCCGDCGATDEHAAAPSASIARAVCLVIIDVANCLAATDRAQARGANGDRTTLPRAEPRRRACQVPRTSAPRQARRSSRSRREAARALRDSCRSPDDLRRPR